MVAVLTLLACSGGDPETSPPPPPPERPEGPPAEPAYGVTEVSTPPQVIRATEVQDRAAQARLDVWFDPDVTTFDALGNKLAGWGFSLLDGDGESWRVGPPPGNEWAARLLPLADVARVAESVDLPALETGALREGSERYGDRVHSWSWREGGPVETMSGGRAPPDPVLPHALPTQVVRCLAPVRSAMAMGVAVGPGWERGFVADPPTWVVLLQDYGACSATGWMALRRDSPVDTITLGGRPLAEVGPTEVQGLAIGYLRKERPYEDPAGVAAWDLLRDAPTDVLTRAIGEVAPGPFQQRLWEELDTRDHAAALALAGTSPSGVLRAAAVAELDEQRAAALADPKTSADVLFAALTAWRPSPGDPPGLLERLQHHASPRVRERAWELAIEATADACGTRAASVATLDASAASALYRKCPQQPVRVAAFGRLATLDPATAAAVVRVTAEEPETGRAGVLAVRQLAALEKYDLLEGLVERPALPRDMRRVALDLCVKAGSPRSAELAEQHGAYLGYRPLPPASPGVVDGDAGTPGSDGGPPRPGRP